MEEKSNEYENEMTETEKERNYLIGELKQIDEEFRLSKEIIEQRNEILSDKVIFIEISSLLLLFD